MSSATGKRRVFVVKYSASTREWIVSERGVPAFSRWATKAYAVKAGKAVAKAAGLSQLVVHGKDGRIQTEHTYPRSSDPRRSKG